jgi:hypothetical protein
VLLARLPCVDSAPRKRSGVSADLSVYRITGTGTGTGTGPVYTGTGKKTPGGAGTHTGTGTGTRGDVERSCEVCVGGSGWL